ncbi:MAG: hypothetical protein FJ222_12155 [Lentisphaerae bacterium]|nr:hypothetical protein [Lentisphaerota bacterium]
MCRPFRCTLYAAWFNKAERGRPRDGPCIHLRRGETPLPYPRGARFLIRLSAFSFQHFSFSLQRDAAALPRFARFLIRLSAFSFQHFSFSLQLFSSASATIRPPRL